jgi:hypothetical protein
VFSSGGAAHIFGSGSVQQLGFWFAVCLMPVDCMPHCHSAKANQPPRRAW